MVGKALAERGHAVVFLEEGELYRREAFDGRSREAFRRFYRADEALIALGNTAIPIQAGRLESWAEAAGTDVFRFHWALTRA